MAGLPQASVLGGTMARHVIEVTVTCTLGAVAASAKPSKVASMGGGSLLVTIGLSAAPGRRVRLDPFIQEGRHGQGGIERVNGAVGGRTRVRCREVLRPPHRVVFRSSFHGAPVRAAMAP